MALLQSKRQTVSKYYKRSIVKPCEGSPYCKRKATLEIFQGASSLSQISGGSASRGYFCKTCADNKLFRLRKGEE